jgi:signal transduction histidine kinase/CheY-like chemotaxis protein
MHWPVACLSFAAGLEIVMAIVMRAQVRTKIAAPFSLGLVVAACWAINYALDLSSAGFAEKLFLLKVRVLFLPFLVLIWFEVVYRVAFGRRCLHGWRLLAAAFIPLVTVLITWIKVPMAALTFRDHYWLDVSGPLPLLRYTNGPWAAIFYGYSYAIAAVAIFIIWRALGRTSWDRTARRALIGALLLGGFLNFAYARNLFPPAGLNYTPVFGPVIYGLLAFALVRGRVLDLAPVARAALIENLEDMLLVLDSLGHVVDLNRAAVLGLRLAPGAVLGRPAEEVLGAWPSIRAHLSDEVGKSELTINGAVHELSFLPVNDHHQQLQARILILRNITDRKKIEEEFLRAKDVAEAADQAKSSFLATISHEIRTPMNAVVGFTHLLQSTTLSAEQREYLNLIEQGGRGLLVIIEDVLDYSKITSGRLELEEAPCQIAELAAHVCAMLLPQAQKRGVALRWTLEAAAPAVIMGDAVRLGQILTNLIGNAVKFTEHGSVDLQIATRPPDAGARPAEGRCMLEFVVRDTGVGIAPEALDRIFRPFSQADNSITRKFGGTGLGLAITRRLCELMHGELSVQSRPGQGATFTARMEVGAASEEDQVSGAIGSAALAAGTRDRPLRILVFEDNRLNQRVLSALLKKLGHHAHFVGSGVEGLAVIFKEKFDAVLMDIEMPGIDGYETVRQLRAAEIPGAPRQHIIALTAHAMQGVREKCLAAGMDDFLTKPIEPKVLRETLQRCPAR